MINRAKFDRARAAALKAHEARTSFRATLEAKHGPQYLFACSSSEDKRLDRLDAAYGRAYDRMFTLLEASPRNWSFNVPAHWVVTELSYDDAIRPIGEPLSVVPPVSYGNRHPIK